MTEIRIGDTITGRLFGTVIGVVVGFTTPRPGREPLPIIAGEHLRRQRGGEGGGGRRPMTLTAEQWKALTEPPAHNCVEHEDRPGPDPALRVCRVCGRRALVFG